MRSWWSITAVTPSEWKTHNFAGTNRHRDVLIGLPRINPEGKPCDLLGEKLNPPIGTSKKRKDMTGVGKVSSWRSLSITATNKVANRHRWDRRDRC